MVEKNVSMSGFVSPNHSPANSMFSLFVRSLKGSSFMTKYNGHIEKFDDLNTGKPSVFHNNEIFCWKSKTPGWQCFLYSEPS